MEKKNVQSTQKCNINLVETHAQWLCLIYVKYTFNHYQKALNYIKRYDTTFYLNLDKCW